MEEEYRQFYQSQGIKTLVKFRDGATEVRDYLKFKHEGWPQPSSETLQNVFGEGLPFEFMFHAFSGLCDYIAAHNVMTLRGNTIGETFRQLNASEDQILAARMLVRVYTRYARQIRSKSGWLDQLLLPMHCDWNKERERVLTEQEVENLRKLGLKDRLKQGKLGEYFELVERNFGQHFRKFAIHSISIEEFEAYYRSMEKVLQKLLDTLG